MSNAAVNKAVIDRKSQDVVLGMIERRIKNHITNVTLLTKAAAETQHHNAWTCRNAILEIHSRIAQQQPADLDVHETELENFVIRIDDATASLKEILTDLAAGVPPITSTSLKLPKMEIPTFSGNFEDWPSFEDLFKAAVDSNQTLTPAQKLQYLKSSVSGEAGTLIKSFTITNAHYHEAWTLLSTRYNNQREIISSLVKKIIMQPSIKHENSAALQRLLDTTEESLRALKVLSRPTDTWDDILVVIIVEKVDTDTKSEWYKSFKGTNPPTFQDLTTFLTSHIRALSARGNSATKASAQKQQARSFFTSSDSSSSCSLCSGRHGLQYCKQLLQLVPQQRTRTVREVGACTNCLRQHAFKHCSSQSTCKTCGKRHHTSLHYSSFGGSERHSAPSGAASHAEQSASASAQNSSQTQQQSTVRTYATRHAPPQSQTFFKTALVYALDKQGNKHPCRILIDGCSEISIVSSSFANKLGLNRHKTDVSIEGVSAAVTGNSKWASTVTLISRSEPATFNIEVYLLPRVTGTLPRRQCDTAWPHLEGLELADPTYFQPGEIDLLLGLDAEPFIWKEGKREGPPQAPMAQNSIFGWILSGRTMVTPAKPFQAFHVCCNLEELVQRFWKMSEPPTKKPLTLEERQCEDYFLQSTTRKPDGRYVVRLPLRKNDANEDLINSIGTSRFLAERRLSSLEKRFQRHPTHHEAYREFMADYQRLGHMELVTSPPKGPHFYIPHHFVLKEDSSTTKLRVVFDASMQSSSGLSLNNCLLVGATVQDDLFSLLVRFRFNLIAIKADIAKMYRQFEVHEDDRDLQRILWRDTPQHPIQEFQLKTVTYGTASAPYLATRALQQLAADEGHRYPEPAAILKRDTYVDDLLSGAATVTEAKDLVSGLISLVALGGMSIRKWCTSSKEVLASIPEDLRETGANLTFDEDASIKALGVTWQPLQDVFTFYTKCNPTAPKKRNLLSEIAKTFDPLGWLSPFTINLKILFQGLWELKVDWDDPISEEHQAIWHNYQQQLKELSRLQIPRCIIAEKVTSMQLIGFSDASEKAIAAATYLRVVKAGGTIISNLYASRTKVAPLDQKSIPKLELSGAVLLVELVDAILNALNESITVHCYTDSMVVLKWLASPSRRWKTYVANRVSMVQESISRDQWHHVISGDNPADLPSRGISVEELLNSSLWWHGPDWLCNEVFPVTSGSLNMDKVQEEQRKNAIILHASLKPEPFILSWIDRFSSLRKLISTTAVFQQYFKYVNNKKLTQNELIITPSINLDARHKIIRLIQAEFFPVEMKALTTGKSLPPSSNLKALLPFIDTDGVMKVGGRLNNAQVPFEMKHPVILPRKCHLNQLIIDHHHIRNFHSGTSLTLASIRQSFWILGAKDQVRSYIQQCKRCRRVKGETLTQVMGQLPSARVRQSRPFLHSGVDYAGPYQVKAKPGRGHQSSKCWFAIFVCMATKAVHLEAVTSLSTEAFIACFRRFSSRRGVPSNIYCDCGTNFVGGDRELLRYIKENEATFQQQLTISGTNFQFNPPGSPHVNGLNEAGVKSVKFHLKRVMGDSLLTLEQFQTLLCCIEACLNSRPLIALSSDPADHSVLTPGHFVVGGPLTAVPEPNLLDVRKNTLSYWQDVQAKTQHFWRQWNNEYLSTLQQRHKWRKPQRNIRIGDMVLLKDENLPPTRWRLGRVINTTTAADGFVRTATVRTVIKSTSTPVKFSDITRSIHKISPLLTIDEMKSDE